MTQITTLNLKKHSFDFIRFLMIRVLTNYEGV